MEPALAGIVVRAECFRRARKARVRIIADRAVGHGREHDRHFQFQLRGHVVDDLPVFIARDFFRLLAEKGLRFHRLAQRIDRRVRDLRGVDQDLIPIHRIRLRVAHGGEEHAARSRLAINFSDGG